MYPDDERAEELKEKLKEFYGTAITSGMPMAIIDFAKVENMTDEEIEREANKNHIG